MTSKTKIVLGWRETIRLPEWGIAALRAKIDTGARTSAIDVDQIEVLPDNRIRFDVVLSNRSRRRRKWITADIVRLTTVRSSNGEPDQRYVVSTQLSLGGLRRRAEFTLVRRANMLCRVLIGRAALSPRYLVDPARTYTAAKTKSPKKNPPSP